MHFQVNNENLREATHDYAIQVLRQTPATVQMLVFRDDSHVKEEDIYDVFTVELIKKPGKGLGLSIVGKRNDVGVYISDIVKGGASEADGRLMQGDQILAVNGEDMRNATQEYAAAVLKVRRAFAWDNQQFGILNRSDTNWSRQPQKQARGLIFFWI